jgi:hypothetical protein
MSGDDDSDRRFGFLLEVRLRCGDLLTATSTPQTVTLHQVEEGGCSYLIKAAESGTIVFIFSHFVFLHSFQLDEPRNTRFLCR